MTMESAVLGDFAVATKAWSNRWSSLSYVIIKSLISLIFYDINIQNNELPEAKKRVEQAGEKLEALDQITTVHGRYYLLSSEYHRRMANHFKFYHEALRWVRSLYSGPVGWLIYSRGLETIMGHVWL